MQSDISEMALFTPHENLDNLGEITEVDVDSFPPNGWYWTPPIHGEDLELLQVKPELEELEKHRLQDHERFLEILKDHGCCSREDLRPCFEDEEAWQPHNHRTDGSIGILLPDLVHPDYVWSMETTFLLYFSHDPKWWHLTCQSSCKSDLERLLNAIPGQLDDLKRRFKECDEEARRAVRSGLWETASQHYEECLRVLSTMENGLWTRMYTWLLLWVGIPLVHIYQLWLKMYPECVKMYNRMLHQLNRAENINSLEDEANSIRLYYELQWHRRLVLFEWSHTLDQKVDGLEQRRHFLGPYVRSKAFKAVALPNEGYTSLIGLCVFETKITCLGQRLKMKSGDADMRVAFCIHMEYLLYQSRQWSQLVQWIKEKWVWIKPTDMIYEGYIAWKIKDVEALYQANMIQEAHFEIERVEGEMKNLKGHKLDKTSECAILYCKVKLYQRSDPAQAVKLIKTADSILGKMGTSEKSNTISLLGALKLAHLHLLNQRRDGGRILEDAPFGLQESLTSGSDSTQMAMKLLKDIDSEESLYFERGKQLLFYVTSSGATIPQRWAALRKAMNVYEDLSRQLTSQKVCATLQQISGEEILCLLELGTCHVFAKELKDLAFNEGKLSDLSLDEECHDHLDIALNQYFQKALGLAETNGRDGLVKDAKIRMGNAHFSKAKELYDRVQWFLKVLHAIPANCERLFCRDKCQIFTVRAQCSSENDTFTVGLNDMTYTNDRQLGSKKVQIRSQSKYIGDLVDEFTAMLLKDLMEEVQKAADYFAETFRVDFATPLDTPKDGLFINATDLRRVENMKSRFSKLQHLLSLEYFVNIARQHLVLKRFRRIEVSDSFLELQKKLCRERCDIGDTLQRFIMSNIEGCYDELVSWGLLHDQQESAFLVDVHVQFQDVVAGSQETAHLDHFISDQLIQQRNTQYDPNHLTTPQKCLLWAERGRSRILIYQLILANRLLRGATTETKLINLDNSDQDETVINKLVNLDFDSDQDSWKILRAAQLACGDNTVFVGYNLDTSSGGIANQVQATGYVINKVGEVHGFNCDLTQVGIPHEIVKISQRIHKYMSGSEDQTQYTAETIMSDLKNLYEIFIRPISAFLDDMKPDDKLVFALDDVLTNVPLAILLNKDTGKYLIENHTISFTPALRVLVHCNERFKSLSQASQKIGTSVALGDPAYKNHNDRLEESFFEVNKISQIFNNKNVEVFTGTAASLKNLLKYANLEDDTVQGFVHVAAHGIVDRHHRSGSLMLANPNAKWAPPIKSSMQLAGSSSGMPRDQQDEGIPESKDELDEAILDCPLEMLGVGCVRSGSTSKSKEEDQSEEHLETDRLGHGILRSENIVKLGFEWRSRMVVLSACNTAKGRVLRSEGVLGLPRAFLVAGVPCVVASQWKLDDKASSVLMPILYEEMSRGSDAATALRAAMLFMKPEGSPLEVAASVRLWGGYLIWGLPTVTLPQSMLNQQQSGEPKP